jgi:cytochrome c
MGQRRSGRRAACVGAHTVGTQVTPLAGLLKVPPPLLERSSPASGSVQVATLAKLLDSQMPLLDKAEHPDVSDKCAPLPYRMYMY